MEFGNEKIEPIVIKTIKETKRKFGVSYDEMEIYRVDEQNIFGHLDYAYGTSIGGTLDLDYNNSKAEEDLALEVQDYFEENLPLATINDILKAKITEYDELDIDFGYSWEVSEYWMIGINIKTKVNLRS